MNEDKQVSNTDIVNIYCVRFDNPAFPNFDNQSDIAYVVDSSPAGAVEKARKFFKLDSDFNGKNLDVYQVNISQDNDSVAFLF